MRTVKFLAALAAVVLVHLAGVWLVPALPRVLNVFVVLVVLHALGSGTLRGLLGGMAAGLAHDALTAAPYGFHSFADTIVGYLAAFAGQRLIFDRASAVAAAVVAATLLERAILSGLAALLMEGGELAPPLLWLAEASLTGVVGAAVYLARGGLDRAREQRRHRSEKLRLGR